MAGAATAWANQVIKIYSNLCWTNTIYTTTQLTQRESISSCSLSTAVSLADSRLCRAGILQWSPSGTSGLMASSRAARSSRLPAVHGSRPVMSTISAKLAPRVLRLSLLARSAATVASLQCAMCNVSKQLKVLPQSN